MSDFNHEKAYFVWVIPAWINLNDRQIKAHMKLNPIVKDLRQGHNLDIPMSQKSYRILDTLKTEELAVLSRVSFFAGYWIPGKVEPLFDNSSGESWKISNLCDQILRERLDLPHNIEIHEGVLRVTFSSHNCWMFEEFGLATEKNLATYHTFCKNHSFSEENFQDSANNLRKFISDLWLCYDIEDETETEEYREYLEMKMQDKLIQAEKDKVNELEKLRQEIRNAEMQDKLIQAEKDKVNELERLKREIRNAEIKYYAIKWLINHNIPYDNWIYYSREKEFCWGWQNSVPESEIKKYSKTLEDFPYPFTIKKEEKQL